MIFDKQFSYRINNNYISFQIIDTPSLIITYNDINRTISRTISGKMARGCFFQSMEYVPTEEDIGFLFENNVDIPSRVKTAKKVRIMLKFTDDDELSVLSSFFVKWRETDVWDRYPFTMLNMEYIYDIDSRSRTRSC